jgi:hypothetical protein
MVIISYTKGEQMGRSFKTLMSVSAVLMLTASALHAAEEKENEIKKDEVKVSKTKRTLKGNMTEVYKVLPKESTSGFLGMFSEGEYYARLRSNTFMWDWNDEIDGKQEDHLITGLGGSFIYKTASLSGFSLTGGLYYSYAFANVDIEGDDSKVGILKAGKDTISRYNSYNDNGSYGLFAPAQYYAQYNIAKTDIKAGQQLYESLFTKSNDTKMIPNSFLGVSVASKDIEKTQVRAAWFYNQKLRDHTTGHDFVTFKTSDDGTGNYKWNNNDDSAVNKSLTYTALEDADMSTQHQMITGDINTKAIENLNLTLTGNYVTEIVAHAAVEAHYKIPIEKASITPGVRYIYQAGLTGNKLSDIANLKGNTSDYTNPDSLDGGLIAARIDADSGLGVKLRYGFSYIEDKADIMALWRGFPTGGFTRAMAQYNWYANTTTHMVRADVSLDKLGVLPGMTLMARYAIQDFDDDKSGVQADTNVLHMDITQKLDAVAKGLMAKVRLGFATDQDTGDKGDVSYNEYRFEINYLF